MLGSPHKTLAGINLTLRRHCLLFFAIFGLVFFVIPQIQNKEAASAQTLTRFEHVSIEKADKILRSRIKTPPKQHGTKLKKALRANGVGAIAVGCASSSSQPFEIVTLANSLKCDLDLIYEYVYDNIEYDPLFGSNKGAFGTLIDQRGSDVDQAQLFVALLNASGITQTNYIYGYITVTGTTTPTSPCTATWVASAPGWLGVKNDGVAIANMLGSGGGIPWANEVTNSSDGTLNCIDVAHVWVQVTIGGTNYVFDPSFKQHTFSTGLSNLGSILGYNQAQFVADAGGVVNRNGLNDYGAVNEPNIRNDLTSYANNLVTYIKANNSTSRLSDIIGGKTIIPLTGSPVRQTSLPYVATSQPSGFPQNWGASVPNAYRSCLAISMPGTTPQSCGTATSQTTVLYSDQNYGQRITIFSTPDPSHGGNYIPTLLVNGAVPSTGINTGTSLAGGQPWSVYAYITAPYLLAPINVSSPLTINSGGSYLVAAGWGRVGRGMVAKHQQLLAQAASSAGANPASESVLGESLAVISYNWLAESSAQMGIADAIGQTTTQYVYGVGIAGQSQIQNSGYIGPYVDLPLNSVGISQQTCWPSTSCPFPGSTLPVFFTDSGVQSSLESAVLQQTQAPTPSMLAASTVKALETNVNTPFGDSYSPNLFVDGTTLAGQQLYVNKIRLLIFAAGHWVPSDLEAVDIAVTGTSPPVASSTPHSQLLIPVYGNLPFGHWVGTGYTIISPSSTNFDIAQKITGSMDGGQSGTSVPTANLVPNTDSTMQPTPANLNSTPLTNTAAPAGSSFWAEPVNAITGSEVYSNTDLTLGSSKFPYGLPFTRTYQSSSYLTDVGLGNGWNHNYGLIATAHSDPYEGFGASSPIRAANAIAANYVAQNILGTLSVPTLPQEQSLTISWLVVKWLTDRLTSNSVTVTHPAYTEEFIALPYTDSATSIAYNPPLGTATTFTGSAIGATGPTSFNYITKDSQTLSFSGPGGAIASWTYPNGMAVNFAYNGSGQLSTVTNTLGRQLTFSYSNGHVASVSDGSRSVNYLYGNAPGYAGSTLASASDALGNLTRYSYDTSGTYDTVGHLTQVFYPNAPESSFVTNFYDGLGRVLTQQNANSQGTNFYFAGSRSEIIDSVGDRQVTYQTPSGQVVMSAAVLNNTYGDVFLSTPQQNGIVNVAKNQYDGLNRLTLTTAPEGGTTSYTYSPDFENNIITITKTAKPGSPLSPLVTSISYDPLWNKPASIVDPRGIETYMSYDPATGNMLTSVADSMNLGAASQFTYTSIGLLATSTNPLGVLTTYAYDSVGNLTQTVSDAGTGHLNQTSSATYDGVGDAISITDPNGNVTANTYDVDRRLITSLSPPPYGAMSGITTTNRYDAAGQLLQTSQSSSGTLLNTTLTAYTLTGKVLTVTDPNGNVTTSAYDNADRLASVTDPVGRVTTYGYDTLSWKISVSNPAFGSPLVQKSYTPDGQLASLTNANGYATTFTTDGFDRRSTTTYPNASTVVLTYDANSNILTRKTRASQTITYTYDTLNRLLTKAAPSEATVTNTYDLAGHLLTASDTSATIQTPTTNGTLSTITAAYDALNHLISKTWSPVQAQAPPTASTVSFAYTYNGANQRITQTPTDSSWWSYPTTAASTNYTHNNLDQYTAIGAVTPTYDSNGNLTFDGTTTYGYDTESRLTSASQGGTTIATYAYDALGHRKSQTVSGTTTLLVNDGDNNPLLDYAGAGGAVQRWYPQGQGSNIIYNQVNVAAGTRATLIPDLQGSVVGSLDSSTGTLTKAGFQPYGESASTANTTFGYTGSRIAVAGLYDMRARFYSPVIGRFLSIDPIGAKGGVNLYAYVGNDPLNFTDPNGFFKEGFSAGFSTTTSATDFSAFDAYQNGSAAIKAGVVAGGLVGDAADLAETVGPALVLGGVGGALAPEAGEAGTALSEIRYTEEGESFIRYESENTDFSRVTSSGGLQPGTFAAPASEGVQSQPLLNDLYNLPSPEIPRSTYFEINPPAGTPIIGPRSVMGGSGSEVVFPFGTGPGSVGPGTPVLP